MLREELPPLPGLPGVYRFLDAAGNILYVGKATSLKNRVYSYFVGAHNTKTEMLVSQIHGLEFTVTDTPAEALLLENTLIKKYQPKYNILLKDDKTYPWLKITNDPYPRLIVTRRREPDGARYFGPFANPGDARLIWQVLNDTFPIVKRPTCGKQRPCLYHHLGMCLAPYHFHVSEDQYAEMIGHVSEFLKGDHSRVLALMENRMEQASREMHFETAARLRNQMEQIRNLQGNQKVTLQRDTNLDVLGYAAKDGWISFYVMLIRNGVMLDFFSGILPVHRDTAERVSEFVERYYMDKEALPDVVLLPEPVESEIFGLRRFKQAVPKRGTKKRLVALAGRNARIRLETFLASQ